MILLPAATVRGTSAEPPAAAFDRFAAVDLPALLTGYGPLPGVTGVEDATGDWGTVGATRTIRLSDGSTARERVTRADRPTADAPGGEVGTFAYRVTGYTNLLRLLAAAADGTWTFAPTPAGHTAVTWRYTFRPRHPPPLPAAVARRCRPAVAGPLRGYMRKVPRAFVNHK